MRFTSTELRSNMEIRFYVNTLHYYGIKGKMQEFPLYRLIIEIAGKRNLYLSKYNWLMGQADEISFDSHRMFEEKITEFSFIVKLQLQICNKKYL